MTQASLFAELEAAQAAPPSLRLSERNCVAIVSKLVAAGRIQILYTLTGKEYVTVERLEAEIRDEIALHRGRISTSELQAIINVDVVHIEHKVAEIVRSQAGAKDWTVLPGGEIVTAGYLDRLAEEVVAYLDYAGSTTLGELATKYVFSVAFVSEAIVPRLLALGVLQRRNVLYTAAHAQREASRLRGMLMALTRPLTVTDALIGLGIEEEQGLATIKSLVDAASVPGTLRGSLYVPHIFVRMQRHAAETFFDENRYLSYERAESLHISNAVDFLKTKYPAVVGLAQCVIAQDVVTDLNAQLEVNSLANSWLDITAQLSQFPLSPEDISVLVTQCPAVGEAWEPGMANKVGEAVGMIVADQFFVSYGFLNAQFDKFKAAAIVSAELERTAKAVAAAPPPAAAPAAAPAPASTPVPSSHSSDELISPPDSSKDAEDENLTETMDDDFVVLTSSPAPTSTTASKSGGKKKVSISTTPTPAAPAPAPAPIAGTKKGGAAKSGAAGSAAAPAADVTMSVQDVADKLVAWNRDSDTEMDDMVAEAIARIIRARVVAMYKTTREQVMASVFRGQAAQKTRATTQLEEEITQLWATLQLYAEGFEALEKRAQKLPETKSLDDDEDKDDGDAGTSSRKKTPALRLRSHLMSLYGTELADRLLVYQCLVHEVPVPETYQIGKASPADRLRLFTSLSKIMAKSEKPAPKAAKPSKPDDSRGSGKGGKPKKPSKSSKRAESDSDSDDEPVAAPAPTKQPSELIGIVVNSSGAGRAVTEFMDNFESACKANNVRLPKADKRASRAAVHKMSQDLNSVLKHADNGRDVLRMTLQQLLQQVFKAPVAIPNDWEDYGFLINLIRPELGDAVLNQLLQFAEAVSSFASVTNDADDGDEAPAPTMLRQQSSEHIAASLHDIREIGLEKKLK